MERTLCASDSWSKFNKFTIQVKSFSLIWPAGFLPLNHQRLFEKEQSPPVSLRAQISTCSHIWRQDISSYNSVSCFSSAALRRGSFFHSLEIFMAEFSRAEMLSDANFPLFKIPKQWSYTIPVFPILLVSGRTLFHCGEGRRCGHEQRPRQSGQISSGAIIVWASSRMNEWVNG